MTVALLVVTDGRVDYLERTVESAREMLRGDIVERWMYDDTGDDEHRRWLRARFPEFTHLHAGPRQGYDGAVRWCWSWLLANTDADLVFHLEQDFTFNRPVDVDRMGAVLDAHPQLAQMALLRQPWDGPGGGVGEMEAGGIVAWHPEAYTPRQWRGERWLEHRHHFTTNPCLYPRRLMLWRWPRGSRSEDRFGESLLAHPYGWRCGYWGDGEEWVTHIGYERAGVGY